MSTITIVSAILSIAYSAVNIRAAGQLWILPVSFVVCLVLVTLVYWVFLALVGMTISMKKQYDRPPRFYYTLLNSGYRFLCDFARIKLHVTGLEKLPKGERFLLVSNHLSRYDTLIQSIVLKDTMIAFISKPGNFRIPVGRRFINRCCYMQIDRENARNAMKTINRAAELISTDTVSIGIYPEGHRGDGTKLQPFRPGCFKIAAKARCPIVVSVLYGSDKVHTNFPFHKTHINFDIIDVIRPEDNRTRELSDHIRDEINERIEYYSKMEEHPCT